MSVGRTSVLMINIIVFSPEAFKKKKTQKFQAKIIDLIIETCYRATIDCGTFR